jgi:hypothetical protein
MTLLSVRYGIPAVLVLAGLICLFVAPDTSRWEAWALFTGSGLSVLLLNVLYRIGVRGDEERDEEDAARAHFEAEGEWPQDEGKRPGGRRWNLPEGIATPEDEAGERPE